MNKIDPKKIDANAIKLIGDEWMLITAGNSDDGYNMMTASWGGLGELWFKPVAFVFIRPQRYTFEFAERQDRFTLSFFGEGHRDMFKLCGSKSGRDIDKVAQTGLTPFTTENGGVAYGEAELVLDCRKLYAEPFKAEGFIHSAYGEECYPQKDYHKMYILEILGAWKK